MDPDDGQFLRDVGARLAELRRSRGLTQDRLAEAIGVDPQTVQRAETGRAALSLSRLRDIADTLDIGLAELFREVHTPIVVQGTDPQAVEALALWRGIPAERRELAMRVLREFGRS